MLIITTKDEKITDCEAVILASLIKEGREFFITETTNTDSGEFDIYFPTCEMGE